MTSLISHFFVILWLEISSCHIFQASIYMKISANNLSNKNSNILQTQKPFSNTDVYGNSILNLWRKFSSIETWNNIENGKALIIWLANINKAYPLSLSLSFSFPAYPCTSIEWDFQQPLLNSALLFKLSKFGVVNLIHYLLSYGRTERWSSYWGGEIFPELKTFLDGKYVLQGILSPG